jgi:CubicO group peptidase (beta-lactamase class C family)
MNREKAFVTDLGFLLLGESIARLHGTSLEEALAARVLRPLGLTSIGYLPMQRGIARESIIPTELDEDWRGRRCWGEVDDENACGIGGVAGHAGLFGTAHDVALLGATWLIPHSLLSISPELRAEAVREQAFDERDRRGLGRQLPYRGAAPPAGAQTPIAGCVNAYGQTGFTGTSLWIALEQQLVVACLTNRVYMGRFKEGIAAFRPKLHDLIAAAFH